jgi:hypothetical protein
VATVAGASSTAIGATTVDRWYLYYRLSLIWLALLIAAFALVLLK